jgi:hypothetical protein
MEKLYCLVKDTILLIHPPFLLVFHHVPFILSHMSVYIQQGEDRKSVGRGWEKANDLERANELLHTANCFDAVIKHSPFGGEVKVSQCLIKYHAIKTCGGVEV